MHIVVFVTAKDKKEAKNIAKKLISQKLIACANIIDKIDSHFLWQGKKEEAKEALLILKTKKSLMPKLIRLVKSVHSYEVPEIIALPIIAGNKEYLRWLDESTR